MQQQVIRRFQFRLHIVQRLAQYADFIAAVERKSSTQVAVCNAPRSHGQHFHRPREAAQDKNEAPHRDQYEGNANRGDQRLEAFDARVRFCKILVDDHCPR